MTNLIEKINNSNPDSIEHVKVDYAAVNKTLALILQLYKVTHNKEVVDDIITSIFKPIFIAKYNGTED